MNPLHYCITITIGADTECWGFTLDHWIMKLEHLGASTLGWGRAVWRPILDPASLSLRRSCTALDGFLFTVAGILTMFLRLLYFIYCLNVFVHYLPNWYLDHCFFLLCILLNVFVHCVLILCSYRCI